MLQTIEPTTYAPDQPHSPDREDLDVETLAQRLAPVIGHIENLCSEAVRGRVPIEQRWLRAAEQYAGIYPEATREVFARDEDRSSHFINITRAKTTGWAARLGDLLFPTNEKNWGIGPTPVPELTEQAQLLANERQEAEEQAAQAVEDVNQMQEAGAPPQAVQRKLGEAQTAIALVEQAREIDAQIRHRLDEAKRRAERMEKEIADQLSECNYAARARDVIQDACKLGSGVMKAPVTIDQPLRRWAQGPGGYGINMKTRPRPMAKRVNPWNFYPDPNAARMEECAYTFERHPVNRHRFKKMAKQLGFHMPTVRSLIRKGPTVGARTDISHVTRLRAIEGASSQTYDEATGIFSIWEFHGYLENKDVAQVLRNFGRADEAEDIERRDDPFDERQVVAYICNGHILKISADYPLDSEESLYSVFSFEPSDTQVLGGVGVPDLMMHEQSMINAGVRMLMDNAGLAAIPQTVVDKSIIEPTDGKWQLKPRKVWHRTTAPAAGAGQDEPFKLYKVDINANLLVLIVDLALKFVDMVVSMPTIAQGEQGQATNTLGGMSMLFNAANVVFRRVVKQWDDDLTEPTIRRMYEWNMQFSDKDEIKGDMNVEARGTSVLLVREVQSQMMMAIATNWSTHPILGTAIKVYDAMRLTLQAMAIDANDILVPPDEFEKRLKAMAEQETTSPEQIRAEAAIKTAEISAESSKLDSQTRLEVAGMQRQTAILQLMLKGEIDAASIQAALEQTRMKVEGDDRRLAAELGMEMQNLARAEAQGREPTGSGGAISMGTNNA